MPDGERIRALHAEGKSASEIAKELGAPRSSVAHHIHKANSAPPDCDGELLSLVNDYWGRLPLLEKVRLLLVDRLRGS